MKRFTALVAFGGAVAFAAASPAVAHTRLLSSSPAAGATVATGPTTITLTFSERVIPRFSKIEVTMPAHDMVVPVTTAASSDGKQIVGTMRNRLSNGSYIVVWTAAGADGHKMTGQLTFKVGRT